MTKAVRLSADMLKGAALLEAECFGEPWSEKSLELLLGERGVGFAVLLDGEVVAYGGMLTVLDEGQITNIAVSSAHRRKGYASAVLASLEEYAEHNGIALLSLEVRESNTAAIDLYTKLGFKVEGKRKDFYTKPTESALIMIWRNK